MANYQGNNKLNTVENIERIKEEIKTSVNNFNFSYDNDSQYPLINGVELGEFLKKENNNRISKILSSLFSLILNKTRNKDLVYCLNTDLDKDYIERYIERSKYMIRCDIGIERSRYMVHCDIRGNTKYDICTESLQIFFNKKNDEDSSIDHANLITFKLTCDFLELIDSVTCALITTKSNVDIEKVYTNIFDEAKKILNLNELEVFANVVDHIKKRIHNDIIVIQHKLITAVTKDKVDYIKWEYDYKYKNYYDMLFCILQNNNLTIIEGEKQNPMACDDEENTLRTAIIKVTY